MSRANPIARIRQERGMTQQQCADRYGCRQPGWAALEVADLSRVSLGRLRKVAKVLACTVHDLTG